MKKQFPKLMLLLMFSAFIYSCSSDDDNNSDEIEDVEGTTWYRQETVSQSGQTVVIDFNLVFETSDDGYLRAETESGGTNVTQTYDFTYIYSQGSGTAEFEDNNIGTQNFTISGNQLILDGETLIRQ